MLHSSLRLWCLHLVLTQRLKVKPKGKKAFIYLHECGPVRARELVPRYEPGEWVRVNIPVRYKVHFVLFVTPCFSRCTAERPAVGVTLSLCAHSEALGARHDVATIK